MKLRVIQVILFQLVIPTASDVITAVARQSDGGGTVTKAERDSIMRAAAVRLQSVLDELGVGHG